MISNLIDDDVVLTMMISKNGINLKYTLDNNNNNNDDSNNNYENNNENYIISLRINILNRETIIL